MGASAGVPADAIEQFKDMATKMNVSPENLFKTLLSSGSLVEVDSAAELEADADTHTQTNTTKQTGDQTNKQPLCHRR